MRIKAISHCTWALPLAKVHGLWTQWKPERIISIQLGMAKLIQKQSFISNGDYNQNLKPVALSWWDFSIYKLKNNCMLIVYNLERRFSTTKSKYGFSKLQTHFFNSLLQDRLINKLMTEDQCNELIMTRNNQFIQEISWSKLVDELQ